MALENWGRRLQPNQQSPVQRTQPAARRAWSHEGVDPKQAQADAEDARRRGLEPWKADLLRGVDEATIRGLRDDARAFDSQLKRGRSGPAPLPELKMQAPSPPPGINIIDAMCDAQDRRDLAEEISRRVRTGGR
jgi:hypothetical protein